MSDPRLQSASAIRAAGLRRGIAYLSASEAYDAQRSRERALRAIPLVCRQIRAVSGGQAA